MPATQVLVSVILVKVVMLVLTLVLTHLTFRAYQLTHRPEIRTLSVGFASISVGILSGGVAYQFMNLDFTLGLLIEGLFSAFGLGMIVYSLYGFR